VELDRMDWESGLAVQAYGVRVGIRADDGAVLQGVESYLPWGSTPIRESPPRVDRLFSIVTATGDHRYRVFVNGRFLVHVEPELLPAYMETITRSYVSHTARRHVFVHAGVVAWDGKALVLPGPSSSGKSTLTAELVRLGATYYSDEFAVIDRKGLVSPYLKLLTFRHEGDGVPIRRAVEEYGGRSGSDPVPIGMVAVARFVDGATWNPRPLSRAEGLAALLAYCFQAARRAGAVLPVLERAARPATLMMGDRGDAGETAAALFRSMRPESETHA
jgi:hypothetical protein